MHLLPLLLWHFRDGQTMKSEVSGRVQDSLLASGLITSPAWVPWLNELNEILTTVTLVLGLALGLCRLWQFMQQRKERGNS